MAYYRWSENSTKKYVRIGKFVFLCLEENKNATINQGDSVSCYVNDLIIDKKILCGIKTVGGVTGDSPITESVGNISCEYGKNDSTSTYYTLKHSGNNLISSPAVILQTGVNTGFSFIIILRNSYDNRAYPCTGFSTTYYLPQGNDNPTGWILSAQSNQTPYTVTGETGSSNGDTYAVSTTVSRNIYNASLDLYSLEELPSDPYINGGISGGGGGTGDFDDTSDTIGLPTLPTLSGLNTGFFTAFVPSASQMQNVSNYLWNNLITDILDPNQTMGEKIDALKKVVANPYDAIMGCSIVPVTPPTAGSKELKMYGLVETGIALPYASTRWVTVDCGTLNIHEFWGGYLDYSPYTKTTSLYLPYIGTVSIDIDLIMNKSLQVVYYVDILSGICVAFVLVDGSVKFHYQGQCATQVPITNADYSSTISAGIGLIGNVSQVVGSAVTGGVGGGVAGAVAGAVGGAISQAPSIASNVMGAKPDIRSGGSIGSSAGILSVQKPYLIIERPKQSLPANQNTFTGYPSNITASVGDLTGYTEFESINLDGLTLTSSEKDELESLLKGGVYL